MGRKANQRTILVLLGVAGFSLASLAAAVAVGYFFVFAAASKPAAKVYERTEFERLVVGKSKDEVLNLLGTPNRTDSPHGDATWVYEHVTYDAVTGKTDMAAFLWFRNGVVARVHF